MFIISSADPTNYSDDKAHIEFTKAVNYLKKSSMAKDLLLQLEHYHDTAIKVGPQVTPMFVPPKHKNLIANKQKNVKIDTVPEGGIVFWQPNEFLEVVDKQKNRLENYQPTLCGCSRFYTDGIGDKRGVQTPAMGLMHELGHAYQYAKKPQAYIQNAEGGWKSKLYNIEDTVVSAIELPIIKELNEKGCNEGIRWRYNHTA